LRDYTFKRTEKYETLGYIEECDDDTGLWYVLRTGHPIVVQRCHI